MAKKRLNETHRNLLRAFAETNIKVPEKAKMDELHRKASELVRACVIKQFPEDDMKLLAKYECARADECFQGADPMGQFIRFEVDETTPEILVPNGNFNSRKIKFTADARNAINAYDKAKAAYEQAYKEKVNAYRSLIRSSYYYEDVLAVWPAAEALRGKICAESTAIVAMNPEVVAFIKRDNAGALGVAGV